MNLAGYNDEVIVRFNGFAFSLSLREAQDAVPVAL